MRLFAELHRDAVGRAGWRGGIVVLLAQLPGLVRLAWITRRAAWQALLLLIVGAIASWIPARRATRVEPLVALRD